jgi:hypothetical protein
MIKSKAIDILAKFNKEEFKDFGRFVCSPYFNENKKLAEIYRQLKKYYPAFSSRVFTKENLYSFLYPGKKYNDSTMRKLLSGLQGLAENFLIHSAIEKKLDVRKLLILLNELDEKKLDRLFESKHQALLELLDREGSYDDDYFIYNFESVVASLNYNLGKGRAGFNPQQVLNELKKCAAFLICHSLITSLKLNQDIMVTGVSYDFDFKDTLPFKYIDIIGKGDLLKFLEKYAPEFYPVVSIYYYRFMVASGKDINDEYYFSMKKNILSTLHLFTRFEKYNLMLFLENSCDEKIREGKNFWNELNLVHGIMLSRTLYTSNETDYFPLIRFRKIILTLLNLKKYNETEDFIIKYKDKLPEEFRENMFYYSYALLSFEKKHFRQALENIMKVKFETYSIKYDVWALKLKTQFELDYIEQSYYTFDALKHSIKNDKLTPVWMKSRFSNFLHFFQAVLRLKAGDELNKNADDVKNEIMKSGELIERKWLLEKLDIPVKS